MDSGGVEEEGLPVRHVETLEGTICCSRCSSTNMQVLRSVARNQGAAMIVVCEKGHSGGVVVYQCPHGHVHLASSDDPDFMRDVMKRMDAR